MGIPPWPPPMRSLLPYPLDRYRVVRLLGTGGQGEVYLAEKVGDPTPQRAIKFLLPRLATSTASDPEIAFGAFLAEAELGLQVSSDYIGRTYEVFDLSKHVPPGWPRAAFVMPYYPCSLGDLLKWKVRFPVGEIVQWTRHLALALAHLHEGRVPAVHRDVKPGNIMFKPSPGRIRTDGPDALLGATAVLTDLGTVGEHNKPSGWTVFRDIASGKDDPYKDPALLPEKFGGTISRGTGLPEGDGPVWIWGRFFGRLRALPIPRPHG